MSPWEINAAIAKACGRKNVLDYHGDLNVIHEAEKVLTFDQSVKFRIWLSHNSGGPNAMFKTAEAAMCHADAPQRCEAFLRTLGLWNT